MIHSIVIIGELYLLLVGVVTFPILIHIYNTHFSLTGHIRFLVHRALGSAKYYLAISSSEFYNLRAISSIIFRTMPNMPMLTNLSHKNNFHFLIQQLKL